MFRSSAYLARLGGSGRLGVPLHRHLSQRSFSLIRPITNQQHNYDQRSSSHHGDHEDYSFRNWNMKIIGGAFAFGALYRLFAPQSLLNGDEIEKSNQDASHDLAEAHHLVETQETPKETQPLEPLYYPYVIVGAGTSAISAVLGILKRDPKAQILMIGEEGEIPYNRTPLSKEIWNTDDPNVAQNLIYRQWNGKNKSIYYESPDFFIDPNSAEGKEEFASKDAKHVKFISNQPAISLDVETQSLVLKNGQKVYYEKLLLATGGVPRQLDLVKKLPEEYQKRVTTYRRLADFKQLESLTANGNKHIAIVGGGFLGSELACSLARRAGSVPNLKITQVFPEDGNMGLIFPKYLSQWTTEKIRQEGVEIIPQATVSEILPREGGGLTLVLSNGQKMDVDHVVTAIGLDANVELAKNGGLELDERRGGVVVNAELEARRNVFASGDVSSYHDIALKRRRVEHYDHAVLSGRIAGENMAGARKPYKHQPIFWSDLGPQVGYEAIGVVDASLVTVGVWAKATAKDTPKEASNENIRSAAVGDIKDSSESQGTPQAVETQQMVTTENDEGADKYGKGIIYYLKNKRVVGILTWNVFHKMDAAREILKEGKTFEDLSELVKLIKID